MVVAAAVDRILRGRRKGQGRGVACASGGGGDLVRGCVTRPRSEGLAALTLYDQDARETGLYTGFRKVNGLSDLDNSARAVRYLAGLQWG